MSRRGGRGFPGFPLRFSGTSAGEGPLISRRLAPASLCYPVAPVTTSLPRALCVLTLLLGAPAWPQGRVAPAGHLATARLGHTATRLADGRVLVVGGRGVDGLEVLASVEVYQPRTGRWATAAPLATGRAQHTATLLPDGRVLVAGGVAAAGEGDLARFVALDSVEVYAPATGRWLPGPPLGQAREGHSASLLVDGSVLVAGGTREGRQALASVERLSAGARGWEPGPPLPAPRWAHQAVGLGDGSEALLGGRTLAAVADGGARPEVSLAVWRFLPREGRWEAAPSLAEGRVGGTAAWVKGLGLLALGGHTGDTLTNLGEAWTPGAPAFVPLAAQLPSGLAHHTATPLPDGALLVVGGERPQAVDSPWVLRWDRGRWCLAGQLATARLGHTATLLQDGRVLVVGGTSAGIPEAQAEAWAPAAGACPPPPGT